MNKRIKFLELSLKRKTIDLEEALNNNKNLNLII